MDRGPEKHLGRPRRLGIFGGTFDAPHEGHVAAARNVAEALDLDVVLWVPAGRSPHKPDALLTGAELRARMVRAVTEEDPRFAMTSVDSAMTNPYLRSRLPQTLKPVRAQEPLAQLGRLQPLVPLQVQSQPPRRIQPSLPRDPCRQHRLPSLVSKHARCDSARTSSSRLTAT